ncbi:TIGR00725 family protein [Halobaculum sp. MBLA0147]|uniref:TIGR00725 family protein n=1 Tax=Halobaculum sp. MBLA0147 TaxID=3079934 RepID=UPI0035234E73
MRISVIGGSSVTDAEYATAVRLGEEIGERGYEVVCGGMGGVMEAVCKGAQATGGHTIGIVPGKDRHEANEYVDTAIATGINDARNPVVVMNGDGVVAVDGGPGTLSEIGHALTFGKPVAGLDTHRVDGVYGIEHVETPTAALDHVETAHR